MPKELQSLDEFNREREEAWQRKNDPSPRPNGLACPKCGLELFDSNPMITLTSMPPLKNVHCKCGYTGYRSA